RIQDAFAALNARATGGEPLVIKLGLHTGPCISVTLNSRLDYYGSAANMAARLQDRSRGGDIVASFATALDPEVGPQLAAFQPSVGQADLKGFAEPVLFYRIDAEQLADGRDRRLAERPMDDNLEGEEAFS